MLTAWQPLEGFLVGFAKASYWVISESSAGHMRGVPGECLLDFIGLSGVPAAGAKLMEACQRRWSERDQRETRVYERLIRAQEKVLRCWSTTVERASARDSVGGDDGASAGVWR